MTTTSYSIILQTRDGSIVNDHTEFDWEHVVKINDGVDYLRTQWECENYIEFRQNLHIDKLLMQFESIRTELCILFDSYDNVLPLNIKKNSATLVRFFTISKLSLLGFIYFIRALIDLGFYFLANSLIAGVNKLNEIPKLITKPIEFR